MKKPDEIKKGLECCAVSYTMCDDNCPYKEGCDGSNILKDALAIIQQLEAERDALIDAVKDWGGSCAVCKHYAKPEDGYPCRFCAERFPEDEDKISHWEWRGVQKEDSNETT